MARVLSLPLTITAGGMMATITQDHPAEITQSVALLLDSSPGERRTLPDYGLPDRLGGGLSPSLVAQVIAEWEPRADPDMIQTVSSGAQQTVAVNLLEET